MELSVALQSRQKRAFEYLAPMLSKFTQAYQFFDPERNPIWRYKYAQGDIKAVRTFDNTGINAYQTLRSTLHANITPPGQKWFKFVPGSAVKGDMRSQLEPVMQELTDTFFDYLDRSNFSTIISSVYGDAILQCGVLQCDATGTRDNPLHFSHVPLGMAALAANKYGETVDVWRKYQELPAYQILQLWPDAELTAYLMDAIKRNPAYPINLIEGTVQDEDEKGWTYYVVPEQSTEAIVMRKLKSSPFITFLLGYNPLSPYGYGPGTLALPSLQTLNEIYKTEIVGAQVRSLPPLLAYGDMPYNSNMINIQPLQVIPVSPIAALSTKAIEALDLGGQPEIAMQTKQDLRNQINDIMYINPLSQLIQEDEKTATEWNLRLQAYLAKFEPAINVLTTSLPILINRVLHILAEAGNILPQQIDRVRLDIELQLPIQDSMALKNVNNFTQYVQLLSEIEGPEAVQGQLNYQTVREKLAEWLDVDLSLLATPEQISQIAQLAQQFNAQQQQAGQTPPISTPANPPVPINGMAPAQQQSPMDSQ